MSVPASVMDSGATCRDVGGTTITIKVEREEPYPTRSWECVAEEHPGSPRGWEPGAPGSEDAGPGPFQLFLPEQPGREASSWKTAETAAIKEEFGQGQEEETGAFADVHVFDIVPDTNTSIQASDKHSSLAHTRHQYCNSGPEVNTKSRGRKQNAGRRGCARRGRPQAHVREEPMQEDAEEIELFAVAYVSSIKPDLSTVVENGDNCSVSFSTGRRCRCSGPATKRTCRRGGARSSTLARRHMASADDTCTVERAPPGPLAELLPAGTLLRRPPSKLVQQIAEAIHESPRRMLRAAHIYGALQNRYPFYRFMDKKAWNGWKSSVRHALYQKWFAKVPAHYARSNYWRLNYGERPRDWSMPDKESGLPREEEVIYVSTTGHLELFQSIEEAPPLLEQPAGFEIPSPRETDNYREQRRQRSHNILNLAPVSTEQTPMVRCKELNEIPGVNDPGPFRGQDPVAGISSTSTSLGTVLLSQVVLPSILRGPGKRYQSWTEPESQHQTQVEPDPQLHPPFLGQPHPNVHHPSVLNYARQARQSVQGCEQPAGLYNLSSTPDSRARNESVMFETNFHSSPSCGSSVPLGQETQGTETGGSYAPLPPQQESPMCRKKLQTRPQRPTSQRELLPKQKVILPREEPMSRPERPAPQQELLLHREQLSRTDRPASRQELSQQERLPRHYWTTQPEESRPRWKELLPRHELPEQQVQPPLQVEYPRQQQEPPVYSVTAVDAGVLLISGMPYVMRHAWYSEEDPNTVFVECYPLHDPPALWQQSPESPAAGCQAIGNGPMTPSGSPSEPHDWRWSRAS